MSYGSGEAQSGPDALHLELDTQAAIEVALDLFTTERPDVTPDPLQIVLDEPNPGIQHEHDAVKVWKLLGFDPYTSRMDPKAYLNVSSLANHLAGSPIQWQQVLEAVENNLSLISVEFMEALIAQRTVILGNHSASEQELHERALAAHATARQASGQNNH